MKKAWWGWLLCLALQGPLAAQPATGGEFSDRAGLYPIHCQVSPWPPKIGKSHVVVRVDKAVEGPDTPPAAMSLLLDMPGSARMQGIPFPLKVTSPGCFEGDFTFSMKGQWRIQYLLQTPSGEFRVVSLVNVGVSAGSPVSEQLCGPEAGNGDLPFQWRCLPDPPRLGSNQLEFTFREKRPRKLRVAFDMAGMPMVIPPQEVFVSKSGAYRLEVDLPMPGLWQMRVDLDGNVPPPMLLQVDEAPPRPIHDGLLVAVALVGLPLGLVWAIRRRPLGGWWTGMMVLTTTFLAGRTLEHYWPPAHAEMSQQSFTRVPIPVLEARVQKLPLEVVETFEGQILPSQEQVLLSPSAGRVSNLRSGGRSFRAGQQLLQVGQMSLKLRESGILLKPLVEAGQQVQAGQPLLSWAPLSPVRVRFDYPVTFRHALQSGLRVEVQEGESSARGEVQSYSARADKDVLWAEASLVNLAPAGGVMAMGRSLPRPPSPTADPQGLFALGQKVQVRCILEQLPPVICIPKTAIEPVEGGSQVYVIESVAGQRVVHPRRVTLGVATATHQEVISGLREGESVVAQTQEALQDGTLVVAASWGVGSYRELLVPVDAGHLP